MKMHLEFALVWLKKQKKLFLTHLYPTISLESVVFTCNDFENNTVIKYFYTKYFKEGLRVVSD